MSLHPRAFPATQLRDGIPLRLHCAAPRKRDHRFSLAAPLEVLGGALGRWQDESGLPDVLGELQDLLCPHNDIGGARPFSCPQLRPNYGLRYSGGDEGDLEGAEAGPGKVFDGKKMIVNCEDAVRRPPSRVLVFRFRSLCSPSLGAIRYDLHGRMTVLEQGLNFVEVLFIFFGIVLGVEGCTGAIFDVDFAIDKGVPQLVGGVVRADALGTQHRHERQAL
mmetsp:Transcript_36156/g.77102  ORF Transcript_36156/g.77102 Transcript_36156/m.77102 type:complete len:220 (-) Transcript_36156:264-923(-)